MGSNEHMAVDHVDHCRSTEKSVDLQSKIPPSLPLTPVEGLVDHVDQENVSSFSKSHFPEPVPIVIGNIVVPFATAVWVRSKESTKLPYRDLKPSLRDAKEIPLEAMPPDIWAELLGPARVTAISKDGLRLRTVNQSTGRTAVFYRNQVSVLPQEVSQ
jgi:hypothetical protein